MDIFQDRPRGKKKKRWGRGEEYRQDETDHRKNRRSGGEGKEGKGRGGQDAKIKINLRGENSCARAREERLIATSTNFIREGRRKEGLLVPREKRVQRGQNGRNAVM